MVSQSRRRARFAHRAPPRRKTADFVVTKRPRLSAFKRYPEVDFADYERRLGATPIGARVLKPLGLTRHDVDALVAFLETL